MNRKIIFLDVDGTLVDYEGKLPDSAGNAVKKAVENGHKVYICTGRSEAEIYDYIWNTGITGMIGANGSYIKDGNTIVLHQCLSLEQEKNIVNWLHEHHLEFYLEANSGLYASEHFEEECNAVASSYGNVQTVQEIFPDMIYNADLYRDDINKISFILHSRQDCINAKREFPDLHIGTWQGAGNTALFGDISLKHISKMKAIDYLLSCLHASINDTYAFGDAEVDIPMLKHCHTGIAMGNAPAEVKNASDYVTDSVTEDGLYHAFQHFGLI